MFDNYHGCNIHNYVGEEQCPICKLSKPTMCDNLNCICKQDHLCNLSCEATHHNKIVTLFKAGESNDPWDKLKVGQELLEADRPIGTIIEVLENIFCLKRGFGYNVWLEKADMEVNGWTIKDSTPKEEEKCERDLAKEYVDKKIKELRKEILDFIG